MAIITRIVNGKKYLYEETYIGIKDGKQKYKSKCLGHLDEDGNLIPSKKNRRKAMKNAPAELVLKTTTTKVIVRPKPIEPEIMTSPEVKKPRKTKIRAEAETEKNEKIADTINALAIPTLYEYENAISLHQEGKAYLYPLIIGTKGLRFEDGEIFFEGDALRSISAAELKDMRTNEGIEKIDIPLLTVYYSIILKEFYSSLQAGEKLNPIITMYAPDLMRCIGLLQDGSGIHENDIKSIMRKTQTFQNIIGVLDVTKYGKARKSYFPVLVFMGYDGIKNTISFSSPYLNHIVETIYNASLSKDKNGNLKKYHSGRQIINPSHSYLIKSSIAKERNKAAVENVMIIVKLIEQAGDKGTPHIKASKIIERNEALKMRIARDKMPSTLLKRVFKKTWELLRDETRLLEVYDGILLPDPEDAKNIPTAKNLKEITFSFPHNGKK